MPTKYPAYDNVFIVDDDPIINFIHQKIVGNIGIANEIRSFTDSRTAFDDLRFNLSKTESVLVLLDINMLEMSGF